MPIATGLYINCFAVGFTPVSSSLQSLTKITQCSFGKGAQNVSFSGDNDRFPTFRANVMQDPFVSFQGGNIGVYLALVAGTYGTVTWTLGDAKNGSGTGSMVFTLVNAMVDDSGAQAGHAQIASGSLAFVSYSSDGTTNPLSYTYAS